MNQVVYSTTETPVKNLPSKNRIEIQWAIEPATGLPGSGDIEDWALEVLNAFDEFKNIQEVCIRIVSEQEIQRLNRDFRNIDKTTNVLAFPQAVELEDGASLLGDIVICAPVVVAESAAQGKTVAAHFTHLVVHGVLHLLGYDHIDKVEAEEMETMEIDILKGFGVKDPYDDGESPNQKLEG